MVEKILIRADGNKKIGIGHITRCVHLTSYFNRKNEFIFFIKKNSQIKNFLQRKNFKVRQLENSNKIEEEIKHLKKESGNKVILDIKNKEDKYYSNYSENFKKVLRIDDSHKTINLFCTFYLNYNLYCKKEYLNLYNKNIKCYLGPEYFILNPLFLKYQNMKRNIKRKSKNILITMGGSDPNNLTIKIIKALVNIKEIKLNVILGKLFKKRNDIEKIRKLNPQKISKFIDIDNMYEMMLKNDLFIGTGGNTSFEAAFMGIPGILINQTPLQNYNGISYAKKGVFKNLGLGSKLKRNLIEEEIKKITNSQDIRRKMYRNARKLNISTGIKKIITKFEM
jgi:UDP-2,4-diacetamido-2,4,6-trideoxy-beta-L-altropyranose hydrolase